jgi:hypothetical protein
VNTDQAIWDIVNYVILNAGKDPAGYSILKLGFNAESINENGWKMKVIPEMQIAGKLLAFERTQNPTQWGDSNKFPTSYPYTTTWGVVVTNDATFRSAFRTKVMAQAKARVDDILDNNVARTYKNKISVVPTLSNLAQQYYVTNDVMPTGYSTTGMRVQSIRYSYDKEGWSESLQLDEDATNVY